MTFVEESGEDDEGFPENWIKGTMMHVPLLNSTSDTWIRAIPCRSCLDRTGQRWTLCKESFRETASVPACLSICDESGGDGKQLGLAVSPNDTTPRWFIV